MKAAGMTHIGKVRNNNEDAFYINDSKTLIAVADGMGGHNAGEIASSIAIEAISAMNATLENKVIMPMEAFNHAFQMANDQIRERARGSEACSGMGTTLTAIYFSDGIAYVAHIGDSRAYLLSKQELKQLTRDHTLVEELIQNGSINRESALTHPQKNVLMRAVGADESSMPDLHEIEISPGDVLIICSDGLTHYISDDEIRKYLLAEKNLFEAFDEMTKKALQRGGGDNITVVGLRVEEKAGETLG